MSDVTFRSCDPMTQDEFAGFVARLREDDIHHYELLDGFVVMEPPASWPHGEIESELVARIWSYLRHRRLGRVFGSSQGFDLPSGDTVEPDVAFVSNQRWQALARPVTGFPAVVPDLVVEILSPGTRKIDLHQKRRIYQNNGVREYWLVDPLARTVVQLVLADKTYREERCLPASATLTSHVLPGLRIPVAGLFPVP